MGPPIEELLERCEAETGLPVPTRSRWDAGLGQEALQAVERRVLWLSTAIIDQANRVRRNPEGLKVGVHQAPAHMASIMTVLWWHHLTAHDPSRSQGPHLVDYSTGSAGIGATAPICGAIARRYVVGPFGQAWHGHQFSLLGDAELDEGSIWETVQDDGRQSRRNRVRHRSQSAGPGPVVPGIAADRLQRMFGAAGWQVLTSSRLHAAALSDQGRVPFRAAGCAVLRRHECGEAGWSSPRV
jgi:pyruvate dehydrogenase E1 component